MGKRYIAGLVLAAAVCLFVFLPVQSVYAAEENPTGITNYTVEIALDGASTIASSNLYAFISASVGNKYRIWTSGTGGLWFRDILYLVQIYNKRDYPVTINNTYVSFTLAPKNENTDTASKWVADSLSPISGELTAFRMSGNTVSFRNSTGYNLLNKIYIPAKGYATCVFQITYHYTGVGATPEEVSSFNAICSYPSLPASISDASDLFPSYEAYLMAVAEAMESQTQSSEDLDYQSEGTSQEVASQHQQEQSYFDQSTQAITDIGLDTWNINSDQGEGIAYASNLFTNIWNALGPFTYIILFILLMKFGTMVLRHRRAGGE